MTKVHLAVEFLFEAQVVPVEFSLDAVEGTDVGYSGDSQGVGVLNNAVEIFLRNVFDYVLIVVKSWYWGNCNVTLVSLKDKFAYSLNTFGKNAHLK